MVFSIWYMEAGMFENSFSHTNSQIPYTTYECSLHVRILDRTKTERKG
jgi:hypothetical protein